MAMLGAYRYSAANSGCTVDTGAMVNIGAFQISGLGDTAALAVCLYVWNPTNNQWEPMLQPATT